MGAEDYPHPARPDDVDHGVFADLSNGGLNAHVERPPGSQIKMHNSTAIKSLQRMKTKQRKV
jgi:hypothetical protein